MYEEHRLYFPFKGKKKIKRGIMSLRIKHEENDERTNVYDIKKKEKTPGTKIREIIDFYREICFFFCFF